MGLVAWWDDHFGIAHARVWVEKEHKTVNRGIDESNPLSLLVRRTLRRVRSPSRPDSFGGEERVGEEWISRVP